MRGSGLQRQRAAAAAAAAAAAEQGSNLAAGSERLLLFLLGLVIVTHDHRAKQAVSLQFKLVCVILVMQLPAGQKRHGRCHPPAGTSCKARARCSRRATWRQPECPACAKTGSW